MKNFKVVFEKPESEINRVTNSTFFHYGVVTDETDETIFEFSLCEMYDENSDSSGFELTIVDNDEFEVTDELTDFIVSKLNY